MRNTYSRFAAAIAVLSLAACSTVVPPPSQQPTQPKAQPQAPPPKPVAGDWTEWPIAAGDWVYRQDTRGSIALFGPQRADATLTVRCDKSQRKIYISRAGQVTSGAQMTLRASSGLQSYPAGNSGGSPNYAAIALATNDFMLDRIATTRGRFAVETTGLASIAVPIWPEFTRVVEDCRG